MFDTYTDIYSKKTPYEYEYTSTFFSHGVAVNLISIRGDGYGVKVTAYPVVELRVPAQRHCRHSNITFTEPLHRLCGRCCGYNCANAIELQSCNSPIWPWMGQQNFR